MLPKTAALVIFDLLRRHTEGLDFEGVILGCHVKSPFSINISSFFTWASGWWLCSKDSKDGLKSA